MGYQIPSLSFLHAARDAGNSAITLSHSADADWPQYRLIDDHPGNLFRFDASGSGRYLDLDRGAAGLEAIDRLLISAGHNLSGETLEVLSSTSGAFAGEETSLGSVVATSALVDKDLTSSTDRYWRMTISGTGQWELPDWWLTRNRTPSRGPDPQYRDREKEPNERTSTTPAGHDFVLQKGSPRRVFEYRWHRVTDTDLDIFDDLRDAIGGGASAPFWIDSTDDGQTAALVRLVDLLSFEQERAHPSQSVGYEIEMKAREVIPS